MLRSASRILATIAIVIGGVFGVGSLASPANASGATYVYISMPTWLGNCPGGGSVKWVLASSFAPSASATVSDAGDDMVFIRVGYGENTQIVAQGLCFNGNRSYYGPAVSQFIRPTRGGQTWWIGPAGTRHN